MTLLTISKIAVALGVKPDVCLDTEPWFLNIVKPVTAAMSEVPIFKSNRMYDAAGELGFEYTSAVELKTA